MERSLHTARSVVLPIPIRSILFVYKRYTCVSTLLDEFMHSVRRARKSENDHRGESH